MRKKQKKIPMYFTSLEIENVKCFGTKQILDLTDGNGQVSPWTLILGDNGVGKTTLLKALAWMVPVEETDKEVKASSSISKIAIKPSMDDIEDESEYEQLAKSGESVSCRIRATFTNGVKLKTLVKDKNTVSHGIKFKVVKGELKEYELEFGELTEFNTINLFAYSASRHMALRNFDQSELKNPISNLFSDSGDLYDAEQALSNLEYASLKEKGKGKSTVLLNKVKEILADLLPDIHDASSILINSPINSDGTKNETLVEIKTPYGKVPLYGLSLGYKTMLAWSVDLALRMLWLNPESPKPLEEPAVVIVDEIDLHLHPKWQRIVRNYLTHHFPNTQFICTAHSPFMAQASESENLCVINRTGDQVYIKNEPFIVKGWRIGQVATSDLFGVPSERSPEEEVLINERRSLLDKGKLTEVEETRLKQLDAEILKLPIEIDNEEDSRLLKQVLELTKLMKEKSKLK